MVRRMENVETPSGWFLIRGPRPPSHQWPLATTQFRPRQPQVHSWFSPQWRCRPQVSARTRCSHQGGNGIKLNPDEKCAAAQLKVRRLRQLEGGDRGFLDPSKDSSSGCGGAVEAEEYFGAIVEEVGRGAGEPSGCYPPDLQAEVTRLRAELAEAKGRGTRGTSTASDMGSPSPEGASKRSLVQLKSCGIG